MMFDNMTPDDELFVMAVPETVVSVWVLYHKDQIDSLIFLQWDDINDHLLSNQSCLFIYDKEIQILDLFRLYYVTVESIALIVRFFGDHIISNLTSKILILLNSLFQILLLFFK
jgi:hypothetical protein